MSKYNTGSSFRVQEFFSKGKAPLKPGLVSTHWPPESRTRPLSLCLFGLYLDSKSICSGGKQVLHPKMCFPSSPVPPPGSCLWTGGSLGEPHAPARGKQAQTLLCIRPSPPGLYLVWAGRLVHAAGVFVLFLGLGLVSHTIGLVHGSHVVAQRDGLHGLVHTAAHGPPDLGGERGALLSRRVLGLLQERVRNKEDDWRHRRV